MHLEVLFIQLEHDKSMTDGDVKKKYLKRLTKTVVGTRFH